VTTAHPADASSAARETTSARSCRYGARVDIALTKYQHPPTLPPLEDERLWASLNDKSPYTPSCSTRKSISSQSPRTTPRIAQAEGLKFNLDANGQRQALRGIGGTLCNALGIDGPEVSMVSVEAIELSRAAKSLPRRDREASGPVILQAQPEARAANLVCRSPIQALSLFYESSSTTRLPTLPTPSLALAHATRLVPGRESRGHCCGQCGSDPL